MTTAPETAATVPPALPTGRRRARTALLTGESFNYMGSAVHAVALPALAVLHLHTTPGQAALLAAAAEFPALIVTLPAGAIVDRYGLRAVLICTDITAAAVVAVIPAAAVLDALTMPLLYAVALTLGVLTPLHVAAAMAAVPLLADPDRGHQAHARYTSVLTVASSIGAALGTVLVAAAGPARALLADALSYVGAAWCATRIRTQPAPAPATKQAEKEPLSLVEGIQQSFSYTFRDPLLRPLVVALTAVGIGGGLITTFLSYHLLHTVKVGTTGLGVIMAAGSLGGLTGSELAPRLAGRYLPGTVLAVAFTLYSLVQAAALFARPGPVWLGVLAFASFMQCAAATAFGTTQRSMQHQTIPLHLQTRVQQVSLWVVNSSQPLAALAAGAVATLTGVRTVMAAGVLVLLLAAGMVWRSPLRRLKPLPEPRIPHPRPADHRSGQTSPARPVPAVAEGVRGGAR
ncbi:MFS transporter [Streptomyces sp. NPDC048717]|uniref:MFS transporter n=1 Tax=Streptomyces sp. NPDC048717 TaxID=3154928 RepID=UPI003441F605